MKSSNIGSPQGLARNPVRRFLDLTERALDALASLLVGVCLAAISIQIVMRYVFNDATTWSDTVAASALAWLTFFAGTAAVRRQENMSVLFLVDHLKPHARKITNTICHLMVLLFSLALLYAGVQVMSITSTAKVEGLILPVTWAQMYSVSVITSVLIALYSLEHIVLLWTCHTSLERQDNHQSELMGQSTGGTP
jgi:TRAP-type C4-dicarboxylate transport system permease small subunit